MTVPSTTPAAEQTPPAEAPKPRQSVAARRFGYAVAILVNLVVIGFIYVWPGWRVLPFLTDEAAAVIALLALSVFVTIAVNLVWIAYDPLWMRSLGDLVTSIVGIVVMSQFLIVFPFDFQADSPWELVTRIILIVGLVGTAIGAVVHLITLISRLARRDSTEA
jgi:hypothetical protein